MGAVPDRALVLATEEAWVFSLWYQSFVEERSREVVPIAVPLLQFDWYWRDTHDRYPDRFPPEPPDDPSLVLKSIAEQAGESGVYFTYWDPLIAATFDLQTRGPVYEALPKTAE